MAEINIKIAELESAIKKLQTLETKCVSSDVSVPATVGGGRVVNELEQITGIYKTLNVQLDVLVRNTISFFQNIRDSYVESDKKATKGISGK